MESIILTTTAAVLWGLFLFGEVWKRLYSRKGTLEEELPCFNPGEKEHNFSRMGFPVKVKLDSGEFVQAEVSGCMQCMNRLCRGKRVSVTRARRGWLVTGG